VNEAKEPSRHQGRQAEGSALQRRRPDGLAPAPPRGQPLGGGGSLIVEPAELREPVRCGPSTDGELDKFIALQHEKRVRREGRERPEHEPWKEGVGAYNEKREEEMRQAWHDYHKAKCVGLRRTLETLIQHHEREAAKFASEAGA
jgi:hypothetical protein